jgi:hypothetical protein
VTTPPWPVPAERRTNWATARSYHCTGRTWQWARCKDVPEMTDKPTSLLTVAAVAISRMTLSNSKAGEEKL